MQLGHQQVKQHMQSDSTCISNDPYRRATAHAAIPALKATTVGSAAAKKAAANMMPTARTTARTAPPQQTLTDTAVQ